MHRSKVRGLSLTHCLVPHLGTEPNTQLKKRDRPTAEPACFPALRPGWFNAASREGGSQGSHAESLRGTRGWALGSASGQGGLGKDGMYQMMRRGRWCRWRAQAEQRPGGWTHLRVAQARCIHQSLPRGQGWQWLEMRPGGQWIQTDEGHAGHAGDGALCPWSDPRAAGCQAPGLSSRLVRALPCWRAGG